MGWKGKNIPQAEYLRLKKRYPQCSPAEIRKLYYESCNFDESQPAITSSFTSSKSQPSIISSSTTSKSQPAITSSSKLSKPEQHQPSHSTLNPTALEALQNSGAIEVILPKNLQSNNKKSQPPSVPDLVSNNYICSLNLEPISPSIFENRVKKTSELVPSTSDQC